MRTSANGASICKASRSTDTGALAGDRGVPEQAPRTCGRSRADASPMCRGDGATTAARSRPIESAEPVSQGVEVREVGRRSETCGGRKGTRTPGLCRVKALQPYSPEPHRTSLHCAARVSYGGVRGRTTSYAGWTRDRRGMEVVLEDARQLTARPDLDVDRNPASRADRPPGHRRRRRATPLLGLPPRLLVRAVHFELENQVTEPTVNRHSLDEARPNEEFRLLGYEAGHCLLGGIAPSGAIRGTRKRG